VFQFFHALLQEVMEIKSISCTERSDKDFYIFSYLQYPGRTWICFVKKIPWRFIEQKKDLALLLRGA
jgi:hypothetical protein